MDNEDPINLNEVSSQSHQGFSTERDFSEYYSADEPVVEIPSVPETYDPLFKSQSGFAHPSDVFEEAYFEEETGMLEEPPAAPSAYPTHAGAVYSEPVQPVYDQACVPQFQQSAALHHPQYPADRPVDMQLQPEFPQEYAYECSQQHQCMPQAVHAQAQPASSYSAVSPYAAAPILVPTPAPVGRANCKKHGGGFARTAAIVLAALVLAAFILIFVVPWDRTVVFNGQSLTVKAHTTLAQIADANPNGSKPGNLLAIDGSVIAPGEGLPYTFTVNGKPMEDFTHEVASGDEIEVGDGIDVTEDFTEEAIELAPSVSIDGVGAVHRFKGDGMPGSGIKRTGKVSGIEQLITETDPSTETMERFNVDTGDDKVIALTFDDGPWPEYTEEILGILAENDAKATFFTVGNRIGGMEDTVRRASESGHQICTHSWDHAAGSGQGVNLDYMTDDEQRDEISKGLDAISAAIGQPASTVVRVPGGNLSENTAKILHEFATSEIGWNIDTNDWQRPGAAVISQRIQSATPGDIVLMHDGGGDRSQTAEALREALPILREQGYRFITIDELLSTYAS